MAILRGKKALAEHYGKSLNTVREWKCPGIKNGRTYLFDTDQVDEWLSERAGSIQNDELEGDGEGPELSGRDTLLQARLRKTQLEADKLQRAKDIEEGLYVKVEVLEQYAARLASQLKQVMTENFVELLESSDLSASEKEKLQAKLIDGFNSVSELEFKS